MEIDTAPREQAPQDGEAVRRRAVRGAQRGAQTGTALLLVLLIAAPLGCWASFPEDQSGSDGTGGEVSGPVDTSPATDPGGGGSVSGAGPGGGSISGGATPGQQPSSPPPPKPDAPASTTPPPPPSCTDGDDDGWTTCKGDCDDADGKVNPDQKSFFAAPGTSGSFDYNCDGKAELERTTLLNCGTSGNCGGKGWMQVVPGCGETGQWAECANSGKGKDGDEPPPDCQLKPLGTQQQRCR